MTTTINASNSGSGGLIQTADASGVLALQTAGTTAVTIDASQNVTLAKGLTVGATAAPAFSAYANASQNGIGNSTWTKVAINTELFDTNNNFDSTTNYRFTPTVAGYYQVNGMIRLTVTGATSFLSAIWKNGTDYTSGMQLDAVAATTMQVPISEVIYFNGSTDYVELYVYVTAAGTKNINYAASYVTSRFSAAMVRSA